MWHLVRWAKVCKPCKDEAWTQGSRTLRITAVADHKHSSDSRLRCTCSGRRSAAGQLKATRPYPVPWSMLVPEGSCFSRRVAWSAPAMA